MIVKYKYKPVVIHSLIAGSLITAAGAFVAGVVYISAGLIALGLWNMLVIVLLIGHEVQDASPDG